MMECQNCFYVAAPGEAAVEGPCPKCGEQPEYDQPSGTSSDFQAFGMPDPGEDDGNQGNPLAVGPIMGKDGERPAMKRDNWMSKRTEVSAPLFYAASEVKEDPDVPMDLVDVIEADDVPKKRKHRDLDSIKDDSHESSAKESFVPMAVPAGTAAAPAVGAGAAAGAAAAGRGAMILARTPAGKILGGAMSKGVSTLGKGLKGLLGGGKGKAVKAIGFGAGQEVGGMAVNKLTPGGGGAPAGGGSAPTLRDPSYYASLHNELVAGFGDNNPVGNDSVPHEAEDGDSKQHADGDRSLGLQVGDDVNDVGGTDQGQNFSQEASDKFFELMPKLLHFLESDESGADDPDIAGLHELLESEHPGYQQDDGSMDDDGVIHYFTALLGPGEEGEGHDPMNETPNDESVEDREKNDSTEKTALNQPGLEHSANPVMRPDELEEQAQPMSGRCQMCGATTDPSMGGSCAQCGGGAFPTVGTPSMPAVAKTASQGPQNDEQKAAVAQLLLQQDRGDEIPDMLTNPENYADELAQVANQEPPPEAPDPSEQPPAMPAQDPSAGMAMPPAAGGGAAPGGMGMMAAVQKWAFDDHLQEHGDNFDNQLGVDAADVTHQENVENEQDTSHTWVDDQGQPLKVGQEYEMFSANYDIPDMVRIEAVKPDSIEYTLTGEYGLEHRTEISHEEAQMENLSFTPTSATHPQGVEDQPDELTGPSQEDAGRANPGFEQSDLSAPHQTFSSENPDRDWLMDGVRTAGAKFTPMEQREFIDEAGVARNADKLDLAGTHYESSSRVEVDPDHFLFGL